MNQTEINYILSASFGFLSFILIICSCCLIYINVSLFLLKFVKIGTEIKVESFTQTDPVIVLSIQ